MKIKKQYIAFILLFLLLCGLLYWLSDSNRTYESPQTVMQAVIPAKLKLVSWHPYYNTVGTFSAVEGITITSQVTARVKSILFKPGSYIQKGEIIIKMDDAAMQAQLKQQEANLTLDKLNYDRFKKLSKINVVSQADYDQVTAKYQEAQAKVDQIKAELSYYTIRAPFSGMVGLRHVSQGQLLQAGQLITNLQKYSPIFLDFSMPQEYASHELIGKTITATVEIDGGQKVLKGKIVSIDSKLNVDTRMVETRAVLNNSQRRIMPGMFAKVYISTHANKSVLVAPADAVVTQLYGNFVYKIVVTKEGKSQVQQIPVELGDKYGQDIIVHSKLLSANDLIVAMGAFKLKNHEYVKVASYSKDTE